MTSASIASIRSPRTPLLATSRASYSSTMAKTLLFDCFVLIMYRLLLVLFQNKIISWMFYQNYPQSKALNPLSQAQPYYMQVLIRFLILFSASHPNLLLQFYYMYLKISNYYNSSRFRSDLLLNCFFVYVSHHSIDHHLTFHHR